MKNFLFKTKRNFRQESARSRGIFRILILVALAIFLVVTLRYVISSVFVGSIETVVRVREYFLHSSAVLPSYIRGRNELLEEIDRLKEEVATHSGSAATIARLINENEELRKLSGDSTEIRSFAGVLARPPYTPYDTLIIDRGSNDGVRENTLVYHKHQHAIGVVSRVFESISLVTLFSSSGVEMTVYVYGPNVFAYAYGEGGGTMRISLPQGVVVKEGDAVVLPSIRMGDIGVVERVVSVPTQPEQSAYVTFPNSIQSIRTVALGKDIPIIPSVSDLASGVEAIRERFRIDVPEELRLGTTTIMRGEGATTTP